MFQSFSLFSCRSSCYHAWAKTRQAAESTLGISGISFFLKWITFGRVSIVAMKRKHFVGCQRAGKKNYPAKSEGSQSGWLVFLLPFSSRARIDPLMALSKGDCSLGDLVMVLQSFEFKNVSNIGCCVIVKHSMELSFISFLPPSLPNLRWNEVWRANVSPLIHLFVLPQVEHELGENERGWKA